MGQGFSSKTGIRSNMQSTDMTLGKRTPKQKVAENISRHEYCMDLVNFMCTYIPLVGVSKAGEMVGVDKATFSYWVGKFGLTVQTVILRPQDSLKITRGGAWQEIPN